MNKPTPSSEYIIKRWGKVSNVVYMIGGMFGFIGVAITIISFILLPIGLLVSFGWKGGLLLLLLLPIIYFFDMFIINAPERIFKSARAIVKYPTSRKTFRRRSWVLFIESILLFIIILSVAGAANNIRPPIAEVWRISWTVVTTAGFVLVSSFSMQTKVPKAIGVIYGERIIDSGIVALGIVAVFLFGVLHDATVGGICIIIALLLRIVWGLSSIVYELERGD